MPKFFLAVYFGIAFLAQSAIVAHEARAQDISAQNRGLPGIYKKTESRRTFTCVAGERDLSDAEWKEEFEQYLAELDQD